MKFLNKFSSAFGLTAITALASVSIVACGDDESVGVIPTSNETAFIGLDSLVIPDSILGSDSLFTWYMEQVEKQNAKSSSSKKGSSSSGKKGQSSSSTKTGGASSAEKTSSSGSKSSSSGNVVKSSSAGKDSEGSDSVVAESSASEEPYDLSPVLLPPGGFYKQMTLPIPAPQKGGTVTCLANVNSVSVFDTILVDAPQKLTRNTAVKCEEVDKNGDVLRSSTQTFFINEKSNMPVVAITVSPYFFKKTYVHDYECEGGDPYRPVCNGIMDEVEYPVHVEFFEKGKNGTPKAWEIDAGISLMGVYSRTYEKKPVAIKMKKLYQEGSLKYPLFDVRSDRKKFKGFNLRNSGNRYVGDYVGDPVLTSLVEGSSVDYQRNRQVVVFYNGVYYGIHDLRERLNEHFVETNYKNIDSKDVDFVRHVKDQVTASGGTVDAYMNLLSFVAQNDFSGEGNESYQKVQTMMDVGNYADYLAAQIYVRNADWPSNNVRAWRSTDQPFKFVLFDLDQGFGWDWVSDDFKYVTNMFDWIRHDRGSGRTDPGFFANIYLNLIQNPDFRRLFINHSAVMLNDFLTYERVEASLNKINSQLDPQEIERDQKRFVRRYSPYGGNTDHFDKTGFHLLEYGRTRNAATREEYREEFELGEDITVTVKAEGDGQVTIDGMKLPRNPYTGTFFGGNDMLLLATAKDGATFVGWSDGKTENPRLVSPEDGDEFTAKFK